MVEGYPYSPTEAVGHNSFDENENNSPIKREFLIKNS